MQRDRWTVGKALGLPCDPLLHYVFYGPNIVNVGQTLKPPCEICFGLILLRPGEKNDNETSDIIKK